MNFLWYMSNVYVMQCIGMKQPLFDAFTIPSQILSEQNKYKSLRAPQALWVLSSSFLPEANCRIIREPLSYTISLPYSADSSRLGSPCEILIYYTLLDLSEIIHIPVLPNVWISALVEYTEMLSSVNDSVLPDIIIVYQTNVLEFTILSGVLTFADLLLKQHLIRVF